MNFEEKTLPMIRAVFDKEMDSILNGETISIKASTRELKYPQGEILINLYAMSDDKDKFTEHLTKGVREHGVSFNNDEINVSGLCFYTLTMTGNADKAVKALSERQFKLDRINTILLHIFESNNEYYSFEMLGEIIRSIDEYLAGNYKLKARIMSLAIQKRFDMVGRIVNKVNVEINQDRAQVIEKLRYLQFDQSYSIYLNEIDQFLLSDSESLSAGMIASLRAFEENLFKEMAKKIQAKTGDKIPSNEKSEMGNIRKYLKEKLLLPDHEDKFISDFIKILHTEGGHGFLSSKEYFRLSKNIMIELALFLLSQSEKILVS